MKVTTLTQTESMSVTDYRCTATPSDRPFVECHSGYSLSFVRKGSFGCRIGSKSYELIAGSILVGYPGDEYVCTHDHHACGDECLSFALSAAFVEALGGRRESWRVGCVPPLAELMVLGELAQATAERRNNIALNEVGTLLSVRFAEIVSGRPSRTPDAGGRLARLRIVDAARWIEAHAHVPLTLEKMADETGLSSFHFLRCFTGVLGVTPHQYLVRCRLRRAAHLLADPANSITNIAFEVGFGDLSNFVRTFRRAAGVSPSAFRGLGKDDRNILQGVLRHAA